MQLNRHFPRRLLVGLLVCFFWAGCKSGPVRPVCHPAHGRVMFDNRPLAEAQLVFHPVVGSVVPLPTAITRSDGAFDVTTWADNDGAPVGEYRVTIVLKELVMLGEEKVRSGRNLLPIIYSDNKRSPLKCIIKEGDNTIPVFELKRQ